MIEVTSQLLTLLGDPLHLQPHKEADGGTEGRASTAATPSFPLFEASLPTKATLPADSGVLEPPTKASC